MSVPFTFSNQTGQIPLNQLDANFGYLANVVPEFAISAGVVTTPSQPAITSVGTLTALNVTGNVNATRFNGTFVSGTLTTSAQPNITTIGTLTDLQVSNTMIGNNVICSTITVPFISGTSITGTLTTAAQPSITSVGTLSALAVSGNIQGGNISTAGAISATGTVTAGGLVSTGVISATGTVTGGDLVTGTITATSISLTGNVQAQGNFIAAGDASITGNVTGANVITAGQLSGGTLTVTGAATLSGGATATTAANGTSNTQVATTAFVQNTISNSNLVPSGVIVMWSGSVASIPAGWFLCDGGNGTPNLRDRFVVGAGSTYSPGATGGSANAIVVAHTHTATSVVSDPGHTHSYNSPTGFDDGGFTGSVVNSIAPDTTGSSTTGITVSTTVNSAGSSGTNANLPPYYALAYIMKA